MERSPHPHPRSAAVPGPVHDAVVVAASDRSVAGTYEDASGPAVAAELRRSGLMVRQRLIAPDDRAVLTALLTSVVDRQAPALVAVTGGTGFAPRDVTPEATAAVIDRPTPGLAEAMRAAGRAITPLADLSRGICGIRGRTLILNLPGSPKAALESLEAVQTVLGHALDLLADQQAPHPSH